MKTSLKKLNLLLIAVGVIIIVIGFLLMHGSTTEVEFNPDIFSKRRLIIGPMTSFFGFLFVVFAILYQPKKNSEKGLTKTKDTSIKPSSK